MFIKQIDIVGFKGINQLSLTLGADFNALIGENRWGRSSLISALMLFSLENQFYQFIDSDFYQGEDPQGEEHNDSQTSNENRIIITATYCESPQQELESEIYHPLLTAVYYVQNTRCITYQMSATKESTNGIVTEHRLVDEKGQRILTNPDVEKSIITSLINLNPVMRLKNAVSTEDLPITNHPLSEYYVEQLSTQLTEQSAQFSQAEVQRGLQAASSLLEYYFVDQARRAHYKQTTPKGNLKSEDWDSLDRINHLLDNPDNHYLRSTLLGIFSSIIEAKGDHKFPPGAVPILVLEEPESLLHPIILAVGFRLLKNFPTQKIVTSNSSDLIALFPIDSIYHLIRLHGRIVAKHVAPHSLSLGDSRRILFHILYRHSSAIFARAWLLVEGETEVWLLRELAEQCGYHLGSEGIQLVEFAQCGLKPLIKYANLMGIHWYVMTDGDMAGKKYADTVQSLCPEGRERDDYLTLLPARDIENFLFKHGFSHIYKLAAYNTTERIDMPVPKIIQKAIHKSSKPDLAIAICDDAKARGVVPQLLREMFAKVIKLSKQSL